MDTQIPGMLHKIKHVTPSHPRWSISIGSNGVKIVEYRARKPLHRCVFFHYATKVKLNTVRLFPFRHHMANKTDSMKTTSSAPLWPVWVVEATDNVIILTFFFILSSFWFPLSHNEDLIIFLYSLLRICLFTVSWPVNSFPLCWGQQYNFLYTLAAYKKTQVIYLNSTLIKLAVQRKKKMKKLLPFNHNSKYHWSIFQCRVQNKILLFQEC